MVAAISPNSKSYEDTHNTLKYASRAKLIKTRAQAVELAKPTSQYPAHEQGAAERQRASKRNWRETQLKRELDEERTKRARLSEENRRLREEVERLSVFEVAMSNAKKSRNNSGMVDRGSGVCGLQSGTRTVTESGEIVESDTLSIPKLATTQLDTPRSATILSTISKNEARRTAVGSETESSVSTQPPRKKLRHNACARNSSSTLSQNSAVVLTKSCASTLRRTVRSEVELSADTVIEPWNDAATATTATAAAAPFDDPQNSAPLPTKPAPGNTYPQNHPSKDNGFSKRKHRLSMTRVEQMVKNLEVTVATLDNGSISHGKEIEAQQGELHLSDLTTDIEKNEDKPSKSTRSYHLRSESNDYATSQKSITECTKLFSVSPTPGSTTGVSGVRRHKVRSNLLSNKKQFSSKTTGIRKGNREIRQKKTDSLIPKISSYDSSTGRKRFGDITNGVQSVAIRIEKKAKRQENLPGTKRARREAVQKDNFLTSGALREVSCTNKNTKHQMQFMSNMLSSVRSSRRIRTSTEHYRPV